MTSSHSPRALTPFAPAVWIASDPVRILGMRLTATMTVVELPGRELLLFSPIAMTPERRAEIDALGTVAHLYAPNTFHHLWIQPWADAYPGACVHAPRALRSKRPELRLDREHDVQPLGDPSEVFDEVHVDGFLLEETALVHRPSGTLLVADLVHNIGRPDGLWTAAYTRMMGFYDRAAISRAIRWTAFRDRAAARRSIDRLAACGFDRLIVGHGNPIRENAQAILLHAYEWLTPTRALVAVPSRRGACG